MKIDGFELPAPDQIDITTDFVDEPGLTSEKTEARFQNRNSVASYGYLRPGTVSGSTYIVVEINGRRYRISADNTTESMTGGQVGGSGGGGGGAVAWGSIYGLLSDQTDLQTALNAKQNYDAGLASISALIGAGYIKATGTDSFAMQTGIPTTDLTGTLQAAQEPAHTGDVTNTAGSLALSIVNGAVTNAKLSAGVNASLALADSSVQSVVAGTNVTVDNTDPANPVISSTGGGGTVPTGTGFTHITAGVQDAAAKLVDTADINNDQVTNAKLANMATQTFKGRTTAGTGDTEDLTIAQAKTMLNLSGTNTGDQDLSGLVPYIGWVADVDGGDFSISTRNQSVTGYTNGDYFDLNMSSDMQDVDIASMYGRDVGIIYTYLETGYTIGGWVNSTLSPMHRYIVNRGAGSLTLSHEDLGSSESYRQSLPGNTNYVLGVNEGIHLHYHTDARRWFVVDTGASSGGILSIQEGSGIIVDNTDPLNPIVSATGGGGGGGLTYTAISTNTTLSSGNLYDVTCSTANITLTLPALTAGDTLEVRKSDSTRYSVIINAPSIMGGTSISITTQHEAVTLFYTGTTFIII